MKKDEFPKVTLAVFADGKILITADRPLEPYLVERLGQTMKDWYDNKVPAALYIPNATIHYVPAETGGVIKKLRGKPYEGPLDEVIVAKNKEIDRKVSPITTVAKQKKLVGN